MYRYEFKKEDAFDFARTQRLQAKPKGEELQFSLCPYCHGGSNRDKGSFAINLSTGQYKCLRSSCGVQGNFVTLARDFNFSLGSDYDRYYSDKKEFRKFKDIKKINTKVHAIELMNKRGISDETVRKYELTIADNLGPDVIVFPFFDEKNNLIFIKYRNMNFNPDTDKNKEWCEPGCMPILFGMKQCNDKFDRLIITEGQIDSLSVAEAGIENAVSVPTGAKGFTWVPYCWDWFSKFEELIVFGDYEYGHITLLEELTKRFPGKIKHVRMEDYKCCKDANDILMSYGKESVRFAVENAESIPVKRVIQFSDVKKRDFSKIHKIKTGFSTLDGRILNGGLYAGQLVILTGKRGDGKSTFAGEIIKEALNQGDKVFSYSGELPDFFFKEWLDKQIAGPSNVVENVNVDGSVTRFVTNSISDKIDNWVRNRFFLYDNNSIYDEEMEDLLKTISDAVMQYGINLVVIDNLMTALDEDMSVNEYGAQAKFVKKLARMAKKYEIVIILIAHPKKNKFTTDENDAVSGSSKITDAADLVFTFKRGKDDEVNGTDTRFLSCSKNRWFGKFTRGEGEQMFYNDRSMRITDRYGDVNKMCGWELEYKKDENGMLPMLQLTDYEQEEMPFGKEDD